MRYALQIRQEYARLFTNPDPATFMLGTSDNPHILVFARQDEEHTVLVIASSNMATMQVGKACLPVAHYDLNPLWGTDVAHLAQETIALDVSLGNGQVLILHDGPGFRRLRK